MNTLLFIFYLILGSFITVLLTKSIYYFCCYLYILFFGTKTIGTIIGYEEKSFYTRNKPHRLKKVFYPMVSYEYKNHRLTNTVNTIRNPSRKYYSQGDEVNIIFNSGNRKQAVIPGNYRFNVDFVMLIIGILYLYILHMLSKSFMNILSVLYVKTAFISLAISMAIMVLRLPYFIRRDYFNKESIKKYCIQNLLIYIFIICLWFISWMFNSF